LVIIWTKTQGGRPVFSSSYVQLSVSG